MARQRSILTAPAFPDHVLTFPLPVVTHAKLSHDREEISRLWEACTTAGFFYYDLRSDDHDELGPQFLNAVNDVFDLMVDAFAVPEKEKLACSIGPAMVGYKSPGLTHVDKQGNLDAMEHWFVGASDILDLKCQASPSRALFKGRYPQVLRNAFQDSLQRFVNLGEQVCNVLLNALSTELEISQFEHDMSPLVQIHAQCADTSTHVRLMRAQLGQSESVSNSNPPLLMPHSDWGTLTILFNNAGGLQMYSRQGLDPSHPEPGWRYVRPLPGHAIINVGDTLRTLTNGVLKSVIHRVVTPPGDHQLLERYSLAYFLRPHNSQLMAPLQGGKIPVQDVDSTHGEAQQEPVTFLEWMLGRLYAARVKSADELHDKPSTN